MIKNTSQLIKNGATPADQKRRRDVLACLEAGLKAVEPYRLVQDHVKLRGDILTIKGAGVFDLKKVKHIYVVGAGKAVCSMASSIERILGNRITSGCVNAPSIPNKCPRHIDVHQASHPFPGTAGVRGTKHIIKHLKMAKTDDLVIGLISGGASALMPLPADGITLTQKIKTTKLLLKSSATNREINLVRKHLSKIKGGQLACYTKGATFVSLYISDAVDDSLDVLGSGPTAPDPSTFDEAVAILKKYHLLKLVPQAIRAHLEKGVQGKIPETPKLDNQIFCNNKTFNVTIGNFETTVEAAKQEAKKLGYHVLALTSSLEGEAEEAAKVLVSIAKQINRYALPLKKPAMIIASGETTVHIHGKGHGGRNQEVVLSGLQYLQAGMTLASLATDGLDGFTPVPVAGAMADFDTLKLALKKKLNPGAFLFNNDSYAFLRQLNEHISTGGYTGTNVADLIVLAVS